MTRGHLAIVLHAHLPYVRHPEDEHFLEEHWFYEAMTETYIPLVHVFEDLVRDDVDFRLTLSLSPTLVAMMRDPLLLGRYARRLDLLVDLGHREVERTRGDDRFHPLAAMYRDRMVQARDTFRRHEGDLTRAFRALPDLSTIVDGLSDQVYVTVDLDGIDSGEMAAVGTPEPGGLRWDEVSQLMEAVAAKKRIVGFDIMELAPDLGPKAHSYAAAKLAYRMMGLSLGPPEG